MLTIKTMPIHQNRKGTRRHAYTERAIQRQIPCCMLASSVGKQVLKLSRSLPAFMDFPDHRLQGLLAVSREQTLAGFVETGREGGAECVVGHKPLQFDARNAEV